MAGYSVTFSVVDNATKQIDGINRRITAMRAPMERLSKQVSRFVDVSGLNTIAKGFASIGRAAGAVLRTLVEIVPVMGTITGAASIAGMAKLVSSYASWSQQLTSTADSLGLTTQQLQQFEDATRLAGGNVGDMDAALKSLYKVQTDFVHGQASADSIFWLNHLGISLRDANGHLRNMADLMPEVIQKIADIKNPADRAAASAALLGDGNMALVEAFRRSHQSFTQWMTDASRYTELSDKQKDQLQSFAEAQGRVATAFDHLGQQIAATLAKNFTPLINKLAEFVEKYSPQIIAAIDQMSQKFVAWLDGINWDHVQQGIDKFIQSLVWVADHLDDIKTAAEVVAAVFAAKWAIGIVTAIGQVTTAIGVAGGLAGGLGLLGGLGAIAALTLIIIDHWQDFKQVGIDVLNGINSEIDLVKKNLSDFWEGKDQARPAPWAEPEKPQYPTPGGAWAPTGAPTTTPGGAWAPKPGEATPSGPNIGGRAPDVPGFTPGGAWAPSAAPAQPLGLPPPQQGQPPATLASLPGDYSWGDYGTRANNPGNMNYASWQHASGRYTYADPQTGGQHTMAVYNTMEEGVADTYKLLARNQEKYGKTLAGALHGWAENSYIPQLAKSMGVDPNAEFDISKADPQSVARMMGEQFRREGRRGSHTATAEQIVAGIDLARGNAPPAAIAQAPPATVPPGSPANGKVDVAVTGKNLPPDTAVTAKGSGAVNVPPPRVEHQTLESIGGTVS